MPEQPVHLTQETDNDTWWSPDDAALPVGKTRQEDEDEPRPIPARRLLYAGVLIFLVTVVTVVFLPDIVAVLTPMGAMVAFGAIVASAVVTAAPKREPPGRQQADGKAVTCGGPRPVGELSRRMAEKRDRENGGCGPGGGGGGSGGGSCGC